MEGYSVDVVLRFVVLGPPLAADCPLWRDFAANHCIATGGADNRRFHVPVLYILKIGNDCNRPHCSL
jgi:hypothetical protein